MIALVALAISPVPPALPRKVNKAGGVAPYGLGLMVTVATLSILYVPLAVNFIGAYFHKPFAMGPGAVAKLIGLSVLLRFFGGWDFTPEDAKTRYLAEIGYRKGVPMGGDLPKASAGAKAPSFLVAAMKDPIGANLDRVQIIKGWLDKDGKTHEQIYDVAWGNADRRKLRPGGKLPPVGDTVDVSRATWTNTIGDPELMGVWTDPHFDSSQKAFYYVRVLEIPTPRWTDYDSVRFGVKMTPDVPMKEQERAWTSPIWYTPGN
jgi:hypothetical protein